MKKLGLLFAALVLPTLAAGLPRPAQLARPNILFILADDLGAESSEIYPQLYDAKVSSGYGQVATPTLSALARRGLVFENAWATPLCSPTRAALLTGLYGHNTTVTTVGNRLPGTTTSLFELLASPTVKPKYNMAVFGKWHLAGAGAAAAGIRHVSKDTGVPLFKGFLGSHITNYFDWTLDSTTGPSVKTTTYSTTLLTDFAIDFIRNQKTGEPWFVYLPYNAPHGTAPSNGFQVPPANLFKVDVGGRKSDAQVYNNDIPVHQAVIQSLDTEIGRLFKAMEAAGQMNNTVIIFMGDNGTPASVKDKAAKIRGSKQGVYEGGVRVPLIAAGPGVTRRGREPHLVNATDIFATIGQLAGLDFPNGSTNNSYSLVPLFSNEKATTGRKFAFTELCANTGTGTKQFAIRDQRYKLLYNGRQWEMFDLESDPWEMKNIFDNSEHARARATLLAELRALKMKASSNGCFVDIPN